MCPHISEKAAVAEPPHLEMSLFEDVLSVEHDGVDSSHLLKNHQREANSQGLVDAGVGQVRQLETGALAGGQAGDKAPQHFILGDPVSWESPTHHFIAGIFNPSAFVLDGRVGSSQEAQGLLSLPPLALGQQEARRLRHKAHADH